MPTAARLFAALSFLLVAFFAAEIIKPHMPEGTQFGAFSEVSALIGLALGWRVLGPAAGRGYYNSAGAGIRTSVLVVLLGLFVFSTENMIVQAFRRAYDGPTDAVIGIVKIALDYGQVLLDPEVALFLLFGGAGAGLLAEWASRRWA
ncbi:MAG: TrgA family protein [Pseudomonadota bacterium]